jgi:hypothetical protein
VTLIVARKIQNSATKRLASPSLIPDQGPVDSRMQNLQRVERFMKRQRYNDKTLALHVAMTQESTVATHLSNVGVIVLIPQSFTDQEKSMYLAFRDEMRSRIA